MSIRRDNNARMQFLADACKNVHAKGKFAGKQIVVGIPASLMHVVHLRVPKMDDDALRRALPWELKGKIPIEPSRALLRHVVAGPIFQDQEEKLELIVMAVQRETVDQFIRLAEMAKLNVVGLQPEPKALLDCFRLLFRKKNADSELTTMFIDIGFSGTRVIVGNGELILFARFIPIGSDQFNYAASVALKVPVHEARQRRIEHAASPAPEMEMAAATSVATADPILDPITAKRQAEKGVIEDACRDPLERLITELELCRRYHEATFPNRAIDRIVFVGGESMHKMMCQQIARRLGIAAQLGDPMVRLARNAKISPESGLNLAQPQPAWAIAVGLSIGQSPVEP
jgi:type IV pilus assembly protein PilM